MKIIELERKVGIRIIANWKLIENETMNVNFVLNLLNFDLLSPEKKQTNVNLSMNYI